MGCIVCGPNFIGKCVHGGAGVRLNTNDDKQKFVQLESRLVSLEGYIKGFTEMLAIRLQSIDNALERIETKRRKTK